MRKALPITLVFCLLTLSIAPFAMAQKQNIITNETTETLYVVYSTKFGAQGAIPDGYRTSGWKTIAAGQQRTFWAYDPHKVYFQIFKGSQPIKPERSTETFAFWINRNANFDIVTRQEINASITRDQLLYSSHGTNPLTHRDGFMQYDNGSRITVTDAWVAVDADDFDPLFPDAEPPSPAVDDGSSDLPVNIPDPVTSDATVVSVDPAQIEARSVGEQLMVNINITGGADVTGYQVTVNFDPTALEYASSAHGDYLPAGAIVVPAQVPDAGDSVILSAAIGGTADGDGTLATITFNVVAAKASIITLTGVIITDSDINVLAVTIADGRGIIPPDVDIPVNVPDSNRVENTVTNDLPVTLYVTFATWQPADAEVPVEGYRTSGYYPIPPGGSRTFHAAESEPTIFFRFQRLDSDAPGARTYLSPAADTPTGSSLVPTEAGEFGYEITNYESLTYKSFNVVTPLNWVYVLLGGTGRRTASRHTASIIDVKFTDVPEGLLKVEEGFIEYENGSDITITGEWIFRYKSVYIPDANLRYAIALAVDKSEYDLIFPNDMLTLTNHVFQSRQIADLTGLEFAHNYTLLSLFGNSIADVSPLKDLVNLTDLDLRENAITDVSPLKDLVNLKRLYLSGNSITDVSPLKDLVNLTDLDLRENAITDVSPLKDLVNLERLYLSGNSITDVSPLKDLVNLEFLRLDSNLVHNANKTLSHLTTQIYYIVDDSVISDEPVNIPDPNLRRAIASELGKDENAPISDREMLTLTRLSAAESVIADLTGLEFAFNLGVLDIQGNISDVSPLKDLVNLKELSLSGNSISDVSPLKNLIYLKELSLSGNSISDVSPLKNLIYLKELSLSGNSISDVSPLKDLVNLTSLYLYDNNISDVSPLKDLVNLETLSLSGNSITDVSPLKDLVNLRKLWLNLDISLARNASKTLSHLTADIIHIVDDSIISDEPVIIPDANLRRAIASELRKDENAPISDREILNLTSLSAVELAISDLTGLEFAFNLQALFLGGNSISDVSPLKDLVNLRTLYLEANNISDVSLNNLVNLERLFLSRNSISDVSALKDLGKLETLNLNDNDISDVSLLKALVNLTSLRLNRNDISDVSSLKALVNLTSLSLSGNSISDVSPLKDLGNLGDLDLVSNNISDVSPLKDMVNLTDLDLSYNSISDVSPLKDLVNLTHLVLWGNDISDISALKDMVNLTDLDLHWNDISDISALKDMVNLTDLDLRYNSISDVSPLAGLVNLERLFFENNPVKNAYTLSHLTAYISGVDIRTCDTHMPDTIESLKPVQVYRAYERTKVSPGVSDKVGLSGSTSAAILSDRGDGGRDNRTWTVHDTMADESGSLTLTVKFLSPSEAKALEPIEPMKKDALVSPLDDLKSRIKELTNEWSETGNITWKFIEPGESGVSDIRIAFLDPSQQILYISWIGSPSEHEKEEYDRSVTMALSTDVPDGTILHEFGHALGLTHEHLSPQFRKWFTWDDAEPDGWANYSDLKWADIPSDDRIYKKIAFIKGYDETYGEGTAETIRKGDELADSIDNNYLEERKVDEMYSNFDNTSVMTYELDSSLLKTLPGAPEEYRALVDEEWRAENHPDDPIAPGIGRLHLEGAYTNTPDGQRQPGVFVGYERLSENDKKFIEQLYGTALQKVEVSGSVHIEGEEHDNFEKPSLINRTKTVASAVHADALEYVRAYDPIIFKWGGEQRVEVHLHHKRVTHRDIEIAVNALLYHGKGTDNTDLDDLDCKTFRLQTGHTEKVSFELTVDLWTSNADPACGGLDIDVHASGLKGGDFNPFFNPNLKNKATVTIKLTASPVSVGTPIDAPAAPSIAAIVRMADPSHDVNGDGEINAADLLLVSQYFGRIPPETPPVDVNNDDTVTIADLVQVAQHLQLSPVPAAPSVSMPAGLTYRTVEGWIDTARVESDGSRAFKIGIANLEALLRLVVPEETALLHNYPNPFNPETWIPYHLSEPAHVDLTIYTVDGKVVRHLDLGHQVAGFYQSKARAAHWDGRNNVGERVASGVYFYTLTAGEFTATRKLLILK